MLVHPQFDPIAFKLGPLAVRWYGLMYLVAFVAFMLLGKLRARQNLLTGWHPRDVDDMLFYGVFGVILGGRLGYVLFYKPLHYLQHPLEILSVWEGGMSFHGGFLGVLFALWLFARQRGKRFLDVTDFVAPLVPLGLAAGRLGNFINGELWGRVTSVPWAMVFPAAGPEPRHPSQLYQLGLEGLLLFVLLWMYTRRRRPTGAASGVFLIGYGACRFVAEFAREPDAFLGLLAFSLSMGAMAVAADGRRRGRAAGVVVSAGGEGRAYADRSDALTTHPQVTRSGGTRRRSPRAAQKSSAPWQRRRGRPSC